MVSSSSTFFRIVVFFLFLASFLNLYSCKKEVSVGEKTVRKDYPLQTPNRKVIKVFFIGNSFSNQATAYLQRIAEENEDTVIIGRAEVSSGSLKIHWQSFLDHRDNALQGKIYSGKSLLELLASEEWDIVSLQQVSNYSCDESSYRPYLDSLIVCISNQLPKAEIVLHQTWAYRSDAKVFSKTESGYIKSSKEMEEKLSSVYQKYGTYFKFRVVPTGNAFSAVSSTLKWSFVKDQSFNYANPVYPDLPKQENSLHLGYYYDNNKVFTFDPNHCSTAGCYLGSLVWYRFLFLRELKNLQYKPNTLSNEFSRCLKEAAEQVIPI